MLRSMHEATVRPLNLSLALALALCPPVTTINYNQTKIYQPCAHQCCRITRAFLIEEATIVKRVLKAKAASSKK